MKKRNERPLAGSLPGPALVPADGLSELRAELRARLDDGPSWRERRKLEAALAALNLPEDNRRMQIWDARRAEIREALSALPRPAKRATLSLPLVLDILHEAAFSMPMDGQRMELTQAELAAKLDISPETVTRAFAMLSAPSVRAVLDRQFCRKSLTWEIDAAFASRLGGVQRIAALKAQDEWHARQDAARAARERAERVGSVPLRERPFDLLPGGRVDDERQPPLLAD